MAKTKPIVGQGRGLCAYTYAVFGMDTPRCREILTGVAHLKKVLDSDGQETIPGRDLVTLWSKANPCLIGDAVHQTMYGRPGSPLLPLTEQVAPAPLEAVQAVYEVMQAKVDRRYAEHEEAERRCGLSVVETCSELGMSPAT